MEYYALFDDVVDDFVARRAPYRGEHQRGELVLAGALSAPADRTLLIFRAPDMIVAEAFAPRDPYVADGLVARPEVRSWAVDIGNEPAGASLAGGGR